VHWGAKSLSFGLHAKPTLYDINHSPDGVGMILPEQKSSSTLLVDVTFNATLSGPVMSQLAMFTSFPWLDFAHSLRCGVPETIVHLRWLTMNCLLPL